MLHFQSHVDILIFNIEVAIPKISNMVPSIYFEVQKLISYFRFDNWVSKIEVV